MMKTLLLACLGLGCNLSPSLPPDPELVVEVLYAVSSAPEVDYCILTITSTNGEIHTLTTTDGRVGEHLFSLPLSVSGTTVEIKGVAYPKPGPCGPVKIPKRTYLVE